MIRTFNDPILHTRCGAITTSIEARNIHDDMLRVLRQHENGVGLAAPQAGHAKRLIIIWPDRSKPWIAMANPEIVYHGPRDSTKPEGCLSFPGITERVKRWTHIRVKYDTIDGATTEDSFAGWHARIIQHEIDHLNGICRVGDAWKAKQQRKVAVTC